MKRIQALSGLAADYDLFLLDLWGVVYDGQSVFPLAAACIDGMLAAGKQVCLLSNAPRRAAPLLHDLRAKGLSQSPLIELQTSGELAWTVLQQQASSDPALRLFFIGAERNRNLCGGLPMVDGIGHCTALLNAWTSDCLPAPSEYESAFRACIARGVVMHCANPDRHATLGTQAIATAGVLADCYQSLGGTVHHYGKPHAEIYALCMARMGHPEPPRVLAIGDGMETDIAGACAAGIDCLLITETGLKPPADFSAIPAARRPQYLLPALIW